jgi:glycosyltransferase involved in cell wall biosynthesis
LRKRHHICFLALQPQGQDPENAKLAAEYSQTQHWVPWVETPKKFPYLQNDLLRNLIGSRLPYVIEKYRSPDMRSAIETAADPERCDILICDFLTPAVNVPAMRRVPSILFQHNVESLIWKRMADNCSGVRRLYFQDQWRRLRRFEAQACATFDGVVAVSEDDASVFRNEFGLSNVLGSVPTGVDTEYYYPERAERVPASIMFLGSMDWMPNIDSVKWFMEDIFPKIKKQFPHATFTIIGRNPTSVVRELADRDPAVRVTGTVDDVRPFLKQAELMVVPLRAGGGTRIKIFEAMATGIPVVSTKVGAEGLPVKHDKEILLADTPDEFVVAVKRLFQSAELRQQIGQAGMELVRARFGWAASVDVFEQYCYEVMRK